MKISLQTKALFVITLIFFVVFFLVVFKGIFQHPDKISSTQANPQNSAVSAWKTYTDTNHAFQFKYPANWYLVVGSRQNVYLDPNPISTDPDIDFSTYYLDFSEQGVAYNPLYGSISPIPFHTGDINGELGKVRTNRWLIYFPVNSGKGTFFIELETDPRKGAANQILSTFQFLK